MVVVVVGAVGVVVLDGGGGEVITITSWRVSEDTLVRDRQGQEGGRLGGGDAGPVYFNNNSQTQGRSSPSLNETLGL